MIEIPEIVGVHSVRLPNNATTTGSRFDELGRGGAACQADGTLTVRPDRFETD
jgi:hypothetical protein